VLHAIFSLEVAHTIHWFFLVPFKVVAPFQQFLDLHLHYSLMQLYFEVHSKLENTRQKFGCNCLQVSDIQNELYWDSFVIQLPLTLLFLPICFVDCFAPHHVLEILIVKLPFLIRYFLLLKFSAVALTQGIYFTRHDYFHYHFYQFDHLTILFTWIFVLFIIFLRLILLLLLNPFIVLLACFSSLFIEPPLGLGYW